jgi:hypothetical protein
VSSGESAGSKGVVGVRVWAYDPTGWIDGQAYTDSNGDYTLSVDDRMLPDSYVVQFDPSGNAGNPYVMQWYSGGISGAASPDLATPVEVTAENDTPHIDARLVTGGRAVAGQAHDSGGHPAADVEVDLYQPFNGGWLDSLQLQTDSSGYYAFPHLPDGTYRVGCQGQGQGQGDGAWWFNPGVPEVGLGTDTVLAADATETVNVVFADYPEIVPNPVSAGTSDSGDAMVASFCARNCCFVTGARRAAASGLGAANTDAGAIAARSAKAASTGSVIASSRPAVRAGPNASIVLTSSSSKAHGPGPRNSVQGARNLARHVIADAASTVPGGVGREPPGAARGSVARFPAQPARQSRSSQRRMIVCSRLGPTAMIETGTSARSSM